MSLVHLDTVERCLLSTASLEVLDGTTVIAQYDMLRSSNIIYQTIERASIVELVQCELRTGICYPSNLQMGHLPRQASVNIYHCPATELLYYVALGCTYMVYHVSGIQHLTLSTIRHLDLEVQSLSTGSGSLLVQHLLVGTSQPREICVLNRLKRWEFQVTVRTHPRPVVGRSLSRRQSHRVELGLNINDVLTTT